MIDFYDLAEKRSVGEIRELYPISQDFFDNMNLTELADNMPMAGALEKSDPEWLSELGTDAEGVLEQFCEFMEALTSPEENAVEIREITIVAGAIKTEFRRRPDCPCIREMSSASWDLPDPERAGCWGILSV